jgi:hypothetical protein
MLESNLKLSTPGRSVECLNGVKGGYSFYNYIGVLEKVLPLKPDVFVMAVFGGNDFVGVVNLFRYYEGLKAGAVGSDYSKEVTDKLRRRNSMYFAQDLSQTLVFARDPTAKEHARAASCLLTVGMQQICEQNDIRLICLYIPDCTTVQSRFFPKEITPVLEQLKGPAFATNHTNEVVDAYLAFLREQGIESIDMREAFRANPVPSYWKTDFHLNTEGHRLIAERLQSEFEN